MILNISSRTISAMKILDFLSKKSSLVTSISISKGAKVGYETSLRILRSLSKEGLIESNLGRNGGYRSKSGFFISVLDLEALLNQGEVVELPEDPLFEELRELEISVLSQLDMIGTKKGT